MVIAQLNNLLSKYIGNIYLEAIILFLSALTLGKVLHWLLIPIIKKLTEKTPTKIDDELIAKLGWPVTILIAFLGLRIGILHLQSTIEELLLNVADSALVFVAIWLILRIINVFIDAWLKHGVEKTDSTFDNALLPLAHRFMNVLAVVLSSVYALHLWGFEIGPLLASLGIAGIAVAFALQNTLGNIFGGLSLILDKNFKTGDVIQLNESAPDGSALIGTVMDIGFRSTKIRTFDNEVMIVPNSKLASVTFKNFLQPDHTVRVVVPFGVEYGSDPEKVKELGLKVIKDIKTAEVLPEPEPIIRFMKMADFSLNFTAFFWISSYKQRFDANEEFTTKMYAALNKARIGIPFPTRTLYLHQAKK